VRKVIRSGADKNLVDAAIKHVNSLLVTFRSEERRKVSIKVAITKFNVLYNKPIIITTIKNLTLISITLSFFR
jgi:hypothetical protein